MLLLIGVQVVCFHSCILERTWESMNEPAQCLASNGPNFVNAEASVELGN